MDLSLVKKFYAVGRHGKIEKLVSTSFEASRVGKKTPILQIFPKKGEEINFNFTLLIMHDSVEQQEITRMVQNFYSQLGKYWPYGEVVEIIRVKQDSNFLYVINSVARRSYELPKLASDLILFVKDTAGHVYFVGIIRGGNPGKGKPGFIGGVREVEKYHFQPPAETLLHEAVEEAGVKIIPKSWEISRFKKEPYADRLQATFIFSKGAIMHQEDSILHLVGSSLTSKQEQILDFQTSRVNETAAYAVMLFPGRKMIKQDVLNLFRAGDDAKKMYVKELTEAKSGIPFGITHHRKLFHDALKIFGLANLMKMR